MNEVASLSCLTCSPGVVVTVSEHYTTSADDCEECCW